MAKTVTLYGPDGQPVDRSLLSQEIGGATLTGIRQVWRDGIGGDLTPARLAEILEGAAMGLGHDYLTLAEEMEEREPHYASVLGTRKRALAGLEPSVEPASEDPQAKKIADAVRELIRLPAFGDLIEDLTDGIGKGYSVCEIVWDTSASQWYPASYPWRDPRFFAVDRATGRQIRLLNDDNTFYGVPLAPFKFVSHVPRIKTGLPLRGGLARLAAVPYLCKSYTLTDWLAFAEVFGMPLRVGRYGPNPTPEDLRVLKQAVANLATDAGAILPDSMKIEFIESGKAQSGGADLFKGLAEWLDKQVSKAVLGQTATTEGTPGKLGNEQAQQEVRQDILKGDARSLANTLNRDLVRPFVDLNFGVQAAYPRVSLPIPEPEDIAALSDALAKLVPLGLRVEASVVRGKLSLPNPPEGEDVELLTAPAPPPAPTFFPGAGAVAGDPAAAANRARARNSWQVSGPDRVDELTDEATGDWRPTMAPVVDPITELADRCGSLEEFQAALPGLLATMDTAALIRSLAVAAFKARAIGDATDHP